MSYSKADFEYLQVKANEILADITNDESRFWTKKIDKVREYVEINRTLFRSNKLPITEKSEFSRYIANKDFGNK